MKKNAFRLVSLLLVIAMVFAIGACGKKGDETTTAEETTVEETQDAGATEATGETAATSETAAETEAQTEGQTEAQTQAPSQPASEVPQGKEAILAAYTKVMNKAKQDKPAYKKIEFQKIPDDSQNRKVRKGENTIGRLLGVVDSLGVMTPEDKAKVEELQKGNDMKWFPIHKNSKGCLLTDVSAIKEAKAEKLANGNIRLEITLVDEKNSQPAAENAATSPSKIGAMFSPLAKADIDNTLNGGVVKAVVRDIKYDLTFHDCKAVLEYNPANDQIVKLEQYMVIRIDAQGKVLLLGDFDLTQELYNTMKTYDFVY